MEIRHDSFRSPDFIRLLRKYRVALVCVDTVEWPRLMDVTSDFVYFDNDMKGRAPQKSKK